MSRASFPTAFRIVTTAKLWLTTYKLDRLNFFRFHYVFKAFLYWFFLRRFFYCLYWFFSWVSSYAIFDFFLFRVYRGTRNWKEPHYIPRHKVLYRRRFLFFKRYRPYNKKRTLNRNYRSGDRNKIFLRRLVVCSIHLRSKAFRRTKRFKKRLSKVITNIISTTKSNYAFNSKSLWGIGSPLSLSPDFNSKRHLFKKEFFQNTLFSSLVKSCNLQNSDYLWGCMKSRNILLYNNFNRFEFGFNSPVFSPSAKFSFLHGHLIKFLLGKIKRNLSHFYLQFSCFRLYFLFFTWNFNSYHYFFKSKVKIPIVASIKRLLLIRSILKSKVKSGRVPNIITKLRSKKLLLKDWGLTCRTPVHRVFNNSLRRLSPKQELYKKEAFVNTNLEINKFLNFLYDTIGETNEVVPFYDVEEGNVLDKIPFFSLKRRNLRRLLTNVYRVPWTYKEVRVLGTQKGKFSASIKSKANCSDVKVSHHNQGNTLLSKRATTQNISLVRSYRRRRLDLLYGKFYLPESLRSNKKVSASEWRYKHIFNYLSNLKLLDFDNKAYFNNKVPSDSIYRFFSPFLYLLRANNKNFNRSLLHPNANLLKRLKFLYKSSVIYNNFIHNHPIRYHLTKYWVEKRKRYYNVPQTDKSANNLKVAFLNYYNSSLNTKRLSYTLKLFVSSLLVPLIYSDLSKYLSFNFLLAHYSLSLPKTGFYKAQYCSLSTLRTKFGFSSKKLINLFSLINLSKLNLVLLVRYFLLNFFWFKYGDQKNLNSLYIAQRKHYQSFFFLRQ